MRFLFLGTLTSPWGASEELWWAAACRLRERGHAVDVLKARVDAGHPRVRELRERGVRVGDLDGALPPRAWHAAAAVLPRRLAPDPLRLQAAAVARAVLRRRPALAVISQSWNLDGVHLARLCARLRLPYVLVAHKASPLDWPADAFADDARAAYRGARSAVFVSEHNRRLTEDQLAGSLPNAEVLRNPVAAGTGGPLLWPEGAPRLACVARLHVRDKAQDVLLRTLARPAWRTLPVTFYGEGQNGQALRGLAASLGLEHVRFAGHVDDVEGIWREHHALVLGSRTEGLPVTLVEAMLCGRPAIVTDAGGSAELVEDGVTGWVAPAPAEPLLDEALARAWARREEWSAMGARAAERARAFLPHDPGAVLADRLLAVAA